MKTADSRQLKIELKNNKGYTGTAEIKWITDKNDYYAFIKVPFKNSQWIKLYIHDKDNLTAAVEQATEYLKDFLDNCTLI